MAQIEAPHFRNPLKEIGHAVNGAGVWTRRHLKPLALTIAALGTATGGYLFAMNPDRSSVQSPPVPSTAGMDKPPESGYIPLLPIETPVTPPTRTIPVDTATPKPSDTPEAAATNTPTNSPTTTPTKPPTPTPTETAMPVEKSPLPEYGAFMGNLRNIKTGENGMIMISPIPKKPKGQQIVIYFQEGDRTGTTFGAYPLDLVSIRDNSFKAETLTSGPSWGKGLYVIEAEWNPKTQTIEGRFIRNAKGQLQEEIRTFEVNFLGIGRLKVLEAVKKTKTAVRGGDWTRVNIEEFERDITLP